MNHRDTENTEQRKTENKEKSKEEERGRGSLGSLSFLTLLLSSLCSLCLSGSSCAADKPNIVLLLCDDLGYGDLGCFNSPVIKTPNLDQLAAAGMKLTHCYAAAPVCSPSRAGIITGRNPNRLGI